MTVNNVIEFQILILKCGLRESASGDLRQILDCVQFYSGMCGCDPEGKETKFNECNMRYRNFLKYNLSSISNEILKYEPSVTFNYEKQMIAHIAR